MAQTSRALTWQNFGRTMRLFAPLYLSNECINNCQYCGFSRDNPILRVTLTVDEVVAEARHLARQGFRQILLVAGEHPKFVSGGYLAQCVRALAPDFSSISIEVGPMDTEDYAPIVGAGAEGLVVYQETYNRGVYAEMHTAGPKRDFNYRLDCAERGYEATTLRDVADSYGVSRSSLYHYVSSKEDLLAMLVEQWSRGLADSLAVVRARADLSPERKMRQVAELTDEGHQE